MGLFDYLPLKFWELLSALGLIIVIIGVVIEGIEHFKNFSKKEHKQKRRIEKIGWLLVVAGLAMEFFGDNVIKRISQRENARLNEEAGDARIAASSASQRAATAEEQAAKANVLAGEIGLTNAQLEADNLILKSNVITLELQLIETITNVANLEPSNQPASDFSAVGWFFVKNSFFDKLSHWGKPDLSLRLCKNSISNSFGDTMELDDVYENKLPVENAKGFRSYVMSFRSKNFGEAFGIETPASALNDANSLRIDIKSMPDGSELISAFITVEASKSFSKRFFIPIQNSPKNHGILIATNLPPINFPIRK